MTQNAPITVNGRQPTHYCNRCGALWKSLDSMPGLPDGGWSLVSLHCGKCCDNAPMTDQILPLPAEVSA